MKERQQITFTVNAEVLKAIEALKADLNVSTTAAVIRRALALARFAAQNANVDDHTITIIDKNNERQKVLLTG
jgi:hypothetical protein